jgi:hypothetical protein
MQDAGYGLRRITLPRTSVNRAKKKDPPYVSMRRVQDAVMETAASGGTLSVVGLSPPILSHALCPAMSRKVHLRLHFGCIVPLSWG